MMGPSHKLFGATAGVAFAAATGQPWHIIAMTGFVAKSTSHGWASPDVDQTKPWRALRKRIPGKAGRMLSHRHLTHWPGLVPAAWWGIVQLPANVQWVAFGLLIGWVSHLLGDAVFGKVPLLPWGGGWFGLGLDTDGFLESGKVKVGSRERKVLPYSPLRIALGVALVVLLVDVPSVANVTVEALP